MRRREFVGLIGAATAWPLSGYAQNTKLPKIGFLYGGPRSAASPRIAALLEGLRAVGYQASDVELVTQIADGLTEQLPQLAAELVRHKVDVVVAVSSAATKMVREVSGTVPIVAHDLETDPIASGLITTFARPGGNITGYFFDFPAFRLKWLELLKEIIPSLSKVAVLWDPATGHYQLNEVRAAAEQLKIGAKILEIADPSRLEDAFSEASADRVGALMMLSSPMLGPIIGKVADLTLRNRIPAVTLFPEFARSGGLMAYGPDLLGSYRQLGELTGKVLQGRRPADLPVERPAKLELVFNLNTAKARAKALGLTIPPSLLARADEVIE